MAEHGINTNGHGHRNRESVGGTLPVLLSSVPWHEWKALSRVIAVSVALAGPCAFLPVFLSTGEYMWTLLLVPTGYAASYAGGVVIGFVGGLFVALFPVTVGMLFGHPPDLATHAALFAAALVAFPLFGVSRGYVSALSLSHKRALSEIRHLRGILPMCSYCKRIREDEGYWSAVEEYISRHSDAEFSHGLCDECLLAHFPEYAGSVIAERERNSSRTRNKPE